MDQDERGMRDLLIERVSSCDLTDRGKLLQIAVAYFTIRGAVSMTDGSRISIKDVFGYYDLTPDGVEYIPHRY